MTSTEHKAAYSGRESTSTRNPHSATKLSSRKTKELYNLPPEQRILEQWRIASGQPVSDEAKEQFQVQTHERAHKLADVRLWTEHHGKGSKSVEEQGVLYLEFFFDGSPAEYNGETEAFIKAFENMIEQQLQERRVREFRQKLATRRRGGRKDANNKDSVEDAEGGGDSAIGDDSEWRDYLRKPIPATNLSVRSIREAGCMLMFLVAQTSLSVSASEVLGQICFQEHFPIDGKPQEAPKSTKPLPKWVWVMLVITVFFTIITLWAWWMVVKEAIWGGDGRGRVLGPP
mmetsp:Transcript_3284/g.5319  ORF Transcript_3284/g.5319 Transcript_3284/m.5319 type:complete len:287 (-) Transcript_3284:65-925(-)